MPAASRRCAAARRRRPPGRAGAGSRRSRPRRRSPPRGHRGSSARPAAAHDLARRLGKSAPSGTARAKSSSAMLRTPPMRSVTTTSTTYGSRGAASTCRSAGRSGPPAPRPAAPTIVSSECRLPVAPRPQGPRISRDLGRVRGGPGAARTTSSARHLRVWRTSTRRVSEDARASTATETRCTAIVEASQSGRDHAPDAPSSRARGPPRQLARPTGRSRRRRAGPVCTDDDVPAHAAATALAASTSARTSAPAGSPPGVELLAGHSAIDGRWRGCVPVRELRPRPHRTPSRPTGGTSRASATPRATRHARPACGRRLSSDSAPRGPWTVMADLGHRRESEMDRRPPDARSDRTGPHDVVRRDDAEPSRGVARDALDGRTPDRPPRTSRTTPSRRRQTAQPKRPEM